MSTTSIYEAAEHAGYSNLTLEAKVVADALIDVAAAEHDLKERQGKYTDPSHLERLRDSLREARVRYTGRLSRAPMDVWHELKDDGRRGFEHRFQQELYRHR